MINLRYIIHLHINCQEYNLKIATMDPDLYTSDYGWCECSPVTVSMESSSDKKTCLVDTGSLKKIIRYLQMI